MADAHGTTIVSSTPRSQLFIPVDPGGNDIDLAVTRAESVHQTSAGCVKSPSSSGMHRDVSVLPSTKVHRNNNTATIITVTDSGNDTQLHRVDTIPVTITVASLYSQNRTRWHFSTSAVREYVLEVRSVPFWACRSGTVSSADLEKMQFVAMCTTRPKNFCLPTSVLQHSMIASVHVVSYAAGGVLFERYYGASLSHSVSQAEWLKRLRDATAPDWRLLRDDYPEQVAAVGEVQIVYKLIGDVVLVLSGTDEHDALLLLDLARSMTATIRSACKIPERQGETRVSAERRILSHYANLCMLVDEHVDDGDIDQLDPQVILDLIRMRPNK